MADEDSKRLIKDMAMKGIEDTMPVFERQHDLMHMGGGTCRDAAISKLVTVSVMHKMLTKNVPADVAAIANPIIDELVAFIDNKKGEQEAEIKRKMDESEPELTNMITNFVSRLFGVDPADIQIEELKIPGKKPDDDTTFH